MPVDTLAAFVETLRQSRLLEPSQLDEVARSLQSRFPDPKTLARELLQRGWLTAYQINQLFRPRGQKLLLGSYVILERLGEGGMGAVYKARNWKLGRIVALKLIRIDRLTNVEAVKRFRREIQAAAQLNHPNVVRAYDADEAGGVHFLVMEFVEGTDLAKLLKKRGPLPVVEACDYVRQAAYGLQHAYERGLVHRDIKPGNLFLTASGVIKVMDMGLARVSRTSFTEEESATMTKAGAVMGSLDYIAPEQASDSHAVDIRADLYSLGCTLYHLLTGRVPFPGGEALGKLLKHKMDVADPIEKLRPDVPAPVAAVVRRLMSKKPEQRYQTPAEIADALTAALEGRATASPSEMMTAPSVTVPVAAGPQVAVETGSDWTALDTAPPQVAAPTKPKRRRVTWQLWLTIAGGVIVFGGMALVLILMHALADKPAEPEPEAAAPKETRRQIDPISFDKWLKTTATLPAEKQIEEVLAKLKEMNRGYHGSESHRIDNGAVTQLRLDADGLTTIAPLQVLKGLQELSLEGTAGNSKLTDLTPLKKLHLISFVCTHTQVADLSPLQGMPITTLNCEGGPIANISTFAGLPLTSLNLASCPLNDLTQIRGMPLRSLSIPKTQVSDLSPLANMRLKDLDLTDTPVADLSPLEGMPITGLNCARTNVIDLSPLRNTALSYFNCVGAAITDFSPLKALPLGILNCNLSIRRNDDAVLRTIASLKTINGMSAADFWQQFDGDRSVFDEWLKHVADMKPEEQVQAVTQELKRRNSGFDGELENIKIEEGVVRSVDLPTENITDVSPLRAFAGLTRLLLDGSKGGKVRDLAPLIGLKLTELNCISNRVADLTPIHEMPLKRLELAGNPVRSVKPLKGLALTYLHCGQLADGDLSPLKDMPLTSLLAGGGLIADLSPLKGMPLKLLSITSNPVTDLSPLQGMPLDELHIDGTWVTDLSPLKDLPIRQVWLNYHPWRDTDQLRSLKKLETINGQPAPTTLKPLDDFDAWAKAVAPLKPDDQVKAVAEELARRNPNYDGEVKPTIKDGMVVSLEMWSDDLADLSPVRALKGLKGLSCVERAKEHSKLGDLWPLHGLGLTRLDITGSRIVDLTPLRGMPLTSLRCVKTPLVDLKPLKNIPLDTLDIGETQVTDLSPLRGMRLTHLALEKTGVTDLSPLRGMPLTFLDSKESRVLNLSALEGMPLEHFNCEFNPWRDTELLKSLKSLKKINDQSAADFWQKADAERVEFDAWAAGVAKMPADKQIEAVKARLKQANPIAITEPQFAIDNGAVVAVILPGDNDRKDISPLRALPDLQRINYQGGLLADLWALKGMRLTDLEIHSGTVADLAPLRGMKLTRLYLMNTSITDLSPIADMPLTELLCGHCGVTDLSPLKGMRLKTLDLRGLAISDFSVLKGMPLTALSLANTKVADLSFVEGMPLKTLDINTTPVADLTPLKKLPLTSLSCASTRITTLAPLEGLPLTSLECWTTRVDDLLPLKGLPLKYLNCGGTRVVDLSPLAGLPLEQLHCAGTAVSDLAPIKDLPLTALAVNQTRVTDFSLLSGSAIKALSCDFRADRDSASLHAIKSLESVNGKPIAQFWKDVATP